MTLLGDDVARFVRTFTRPDETLLAMDEYAATHDFPHVGPAVGAYLAQLARLTDTRRVFEFGSGYGYSAYWLARTLGDDGEIVLTDVDAALLERAETYLERGGYADLARFEVGDALETVERYEGPFDLVLIDHEKPRYREAFEAIRSKLRPGSVIVADNAMTASVIDFDVLAALADGESPAGVDEHTHGIWAYLERITNDPAFETVVMPLGEGIAVSDYVGE